MGAKVLGEKIVEGWEIPFIKVYLLA